MNLTCKGIDHIDTYLDELNRLRAIADKANATIATAGTNTAGTIAGESAEACAQRLAAQQIAAQSAEEVCAAAAKEADGILAKLWKGCKWLGPRVGCTLLGAGVEIASCNTNIDAAGDMPLTCHELLVVEAQRCLTLLRLLEQTDQAIEGTKLSIGENQRLCSSFDDAPDPQKRADYCVKMAKLYNENLRLQESRKLELTNDFNQCNRLVDRLEEECVKMPSFTPTPSDSQAPPVMPSFTPTPSDSQAPPVMPSFTPTPSDSQAPPVMPSFTPTPSDSQAPPVMPSFSPTPSHSSPGMPSGFGALPPAAPVTGPSSPSGMLFPR